LTNADKSTCSLLLQAMPTFHFLKNSELVDEFKGADPKKLKELVAKHAT
jgi:thioredoxin-like negative regulator of GroEL